MVSDGITKGKLMQNRDWGSGALCERAALLFPVHTTLVHLL